MPRDRPDLRDVPVVAPQRQPNGNRRVPPLPTEEQVVALAPGVCGVDRV
ncbi:MAG: hypothetical protein ACK5VE_06485 [Alphaproteobacteria bacterium]